MVNTVYDICQLVNDFERTFYVELEDEKRNQILNDDAYLDYYYFKKIKEEETYD